MARSDGSRSFRIASRKVRSSAALRSGLSKDLPSVSRRQSRCTSGTEAIQMALHRARPFGSGSGRRGQDLRASGRTASDLPASINGSARSTTPHRRAQACRVAVKRDDRLVGDAPEQLQLVFGDRGAQRGDRGPETGLGQGDHVHVAFGHDQRLALARRFARRGRGYRDCGPCRTIRFRANLVFGARVRVHRAPAKRDRATARVADRKDDAAAKPVIGRARRHRVLRRAPRQRSSPRSPPCRSGAEKALAAVGRKPDLPAILSGFAQTAPGKIFARRRCGAGLQLQAKMLHRLLHHRRKFACGGRTFPVPWGRARASAFRLRAPGFPPLR